MTSEPTELAERFWPRVDRRGPDECWPWLGYTGNMGYGVFRFHNRRTSAHRFAYELARGPIPAGMHLDHLCRTPICVNPAHLEPVTPRENVMRSRNHVADQVHRTHCPKGHPYAGTNLRVRGGKRYCFQCAADRQRAAARFT